MDLLVGDGVRTRESVGACARVGVYVCVCKATYIRVCMYKCLCIIFIHVCEYLCEYMGVYVCTCIDVYHF